MKTISWVKDGNSQSSGYPKSRVGHTLTFIPDTGMYLLYGGISSKRITEISIYNPSLKMWSFQETSGKIPLPTCYHCAWYESPNFFIMGGETEKKKINDIYCLNVETWVWRKLFVFEPPPPRYQHSISKIEKDNAIYMFGGYSQQKFSFCNKNDLWELDLSLLNFKGKDDIPGAVWTSLAQKGSVPTARRGHKMSKIPGENKLVLYGGYTLQNEDIGKKHDNDIYVLDVKSITWSKLKFEGVSLESRALHCMGFFDESKLFIMGGIATECEESDNSRFLSNTFLVNFDTEEITQPFIANEGPSARYGHICCSNEDPKEPELVIIGGMNSTFCAMDPYKITYQSQSLPSNKPQFSTQSKTFGFEETKFERLDNRIKSESSQDDEENAADQILLYKNQQIELANLNKSIQDNTKIIFELENEGLAIASENSKKCKQINELKTEIGELESKKVIIQRSLKERNTNLKAKFETNKANVECLISLINEKEKLKEIYSKKIEVLQQNFSKAELFLLKLLPVYERLEIAFNEGQGISTDPSKRAVEYNMVEVLKTQFNKSLNY